MLYFKITAYMTLRIIIIYRFVRNRLKYTNTYTIHDEKTNHFNYYSLFEFSRSHIIIYIIYYCV